MMPKTTKQEILKLGEIVHKEFPKAYGFLIIAVDKEVLYSKVAMDSEGLSEYYINLDRKRLGIYEIIKKD